MSRFKIFSLLSGLTFLMSCTQGPDLDWLTGKWYMEEGSLITVEEWEQTGPAEWKGLGYSMDGTDSVFVEEMRIFMMDDSLYFEVLLPDAETPKYFVNISEAPDRLHFQDLTNDFPTDLFYKVVRDSLHVQLKGGEREILLKFSK
jgi:hypothetical protein